MADIAALKVLNGQIEAFKKLPNPPNNIDGIAGYRKKVEETVSNATKSVTEVASYADQVFKKLQELKECIPCQINRIQKVIEEQLEAIKRKNVQSDLVIGTRGLDAPSSGNVRMIVPSESTAFSPSAAMVSAKKPERIQKTNDTLEKLKLIHEMEITAKLMSQNNLDDMIRETEKACAKVKSGGDLNDTDIDKLKGHLNSWQIVKKHDFENDQKKTNLPKKTSVENEQKQKEKEDKERKEKEKKRQKEEEQRRKEEQERKRREAEERRQQEDEEKRQREEAERLRREAEEKKKREERLKRKDEEERRKREEAEKRKREEEERLRREEEEKQRREEEERLRKEEEERIKREEEERRKREEEERRQREEEEIKRKQEEERLKREAEKKRKEEERLERERKQREEEERRRRLDHNNWDPHVYERPSDGQVPGRKQPFHGCVCCMVSSPSGDIEKEELECEASDELDNVTEILDDGEKTASSVISVQSKKGRLLLEAPARVYIPHCQIPIASEELVMKMSINDSDWITTNIVLPSSKVAEKEKEVALTNLVGMELNNFDSVKAMVVSRPRGQTVIVDRPGLNVSSISDQRVKLFVPRDCFPTRTAMRLVVQPVPKETIASSAKDQDGLWNSSMSSGCMVTISCERVPVKTIEVDLTTSTQGHSSSQKGKLYHMYATRDGLWKHADEEYKSVNNVVSVTLPAYKAKYNLLELELPTNTSKESALSLAKAIHEHFNKVPVRFVVKRHIENPNETIVMLIQCKILTQQLEAIAENGYSLGPDISSEFVLKEGQKLILSCGGNIGITEETNAKTHFSFFTYMDTAKQCLTIHVKDMYKQKDLPEYMGIMKLTVDNGTEIPDEEYELTITLPKPERQRVSVISKRVRFPYWLTSLACYLSLNLCELEDVAWSDVLTTLMGKKAFSSGVRLAKRKIDEADNRAMCKTILFDWMKATPKQDDKVGPIREALKDYKLYELETKCQNLVQFQKDNLSDKILADIASNTSRDFDTIASELQLDDETVNNCRTDPDNPILALLVEWRESDAAVVLEERALDALKSICGV